MSTFPSRARLQAHGIVGLVLIVTVVALAMAVYKQAFTSSTTVTVTAERAGLLLDPGADVRLRGIRIGRVTSVKPGAHGGAVLELALDPEDAKHVPPDATAEIVPATVFGSKTVNLSASQGRPQPAIADGAHIRATHISAETNDVFRGLEDLLTTVHPSQLNATLGSLAGALDGRGTSIGMAVTSLDGYLGALNPHLATVHTDLVTGAEVANTYAAVTPDIATLARDLTTTSRTLAQTQPALHALLLGLSNASRTGQDFLSLIEDPLVHAMHQLVPVTSLLARYSPELTCTVKGLNEARKRLSLVLGGQKDGIQALGSALPSSEGYQYPRDLPQFASGNGPHCYGLPIIPEADMPSPRYLFDDGMHNFGGSPAIHPGDPPVHVFNELLGPLPAGWGKR